MMLKDLSVWIKLQILNNTKNEEKLMKILLNDKENFEVRKAVIKKLPNNVKIEDLLVKIWGNDSKLLSEELLRKVDDEDIVLHIFNKIHARGTLSYIEGYLQKRMSEIFEERIEKTDDSAKLVSIWDRMLNYDQKFSNIHRVIEKLIAKISDNDILAGKILKIYARSDQIDCYVVKGLVKKLEQKNGFEEFFSRIDDMEFLAYCFYKIRENKLKVPAQNRIRSLGKEIVVAEEKKQITCPSCNGSKGGEVRVKYTDRDWEWEECDRCNGTGSVVEMFQNHCFK